MPEFEETEQTCEDSPVEEYTIVASSMDSGSTGATLLYLEVLSVQSGSAISKKGAPTPRS